MIIYHKNKIIDLNITEHPYTIFLSDEEIEMLKNNDKNVAVIHGGEKKDLTKEENRALFEHNMLRIGKHIEKTYK
jgi:hypothetical protein